MDGLFDSAWLKWGWAVAEAQKLDAEVKAFAADRETQALTRTRLEYHPKRHCFILVVTSLPPWPAFLSLRLGNVVHNYRSALDHLAWALVTRGATPPHTLSKRAQTNIYFPIHRASTGFRKVCDSKLPGVSRDARKIIRVYQPYITGKRKIPHHALAVLDALSKQDKHRAIQPLLSLSSERSSYEVRHTTNCVHRKTVPSPGGRTLEVKAELARFYIRKTGGGDPDLGLEIDTTVEPAVNEVFRLQDWIGRIEIGIARLLGEFARPPKEIGTLGIIPSSGEYRPTGSH